MRATALVADVCEGHDRKKAYDAAYAVAMVCPGLGDQPADDR